jgi:hypothetical protein
MYLYIDVVRFGLIAALTIGGYLGVVPWWVGPTMLWYNLASYVVNIPIPGTRKPKKGLTVEQWAQMVAAAQRAAGPEDKEDLN